MIFSTAIAFATQHPAFLQFMNIHHTNPDSANKLTAVLVPGPSTQFFYLLIFLDFRAPGPVLGEVKIQIVLQKSDASLSFDKVLLIPPSAGIAAYQQWQ